MHLHPLMIMQRSQNYAHESEDASHEEHHLLDLCTGSKPCRQDVRGQHDVQEGLRRCHGVHAAAERHWDLKTLHYETAGVVTA